nr:glioma pathogenesis protein 1 [Hymenolepis microstoma]
MKMMHLFVIAVLIAWPCSGELIADEHAEIITSHNGIRSNVQPGAQNMLEMVYSTELETEAQKLLDDNCKSRVTTAENQHVNYATKQGEANWTKLIEEWGNEGGKYTYEGNKCDDSTNSCKHYLQVVWAAAEKVGCAKKECPSPSEKPSLKNENKIVMLCLYDQGPAATPTVPYEQGDPCHNCDKTKYPTCPDKLCSTKLAIETTTSSTTCVSSSGVLAMMSLLIGNHFN